MKNWMRSNWTAGAHGKRQVIVAGMLLFTLGGGVGYAAWDTMKPATQYRVVIEGEDKKGHFYTVLSVASPSKWQARPVAVLAAKKKGIEIVRVEEIEAMGPAPRNQRWAVLKAPWDKVYFPSDHKCAHKHDQKNEPCKDKHDHEHDHDHAH